VVDIEREAIPRITKALAEAFSVRRRGLPSPLDKAGEAIVVACMIDRFILVILLALIVLYTVVMAWMNWRKPPQ